MREVLRRFIAVVAAFVPADARREFRAEWDGELAVRPSWRRALGAVPDAWCLFRQQWSFDMVTQDVVYALRLMRQRVGYTALIVVTLAIGIGATTAMFSVMHAVLLRPLPFRDPSRVVMIWENDRLNGKPRYPIAPANFDDWRRQTRAFDALAGWIDQMGTVRAGGEPFMANVAVVTTNFFDALGAAPVIGRGFSRDDAPPAQHVLIISYRVWMSHFGGDPSIVDRSIRLGASDYRIVGVMPAAFEFPNRGVDVWRPLAEHPQLMATRAQHMMSAVGRLRAGVTVAGAAQDLERIAAELQRQYPQTNEQRGTTVVPVQEAVVGDVRRPVYFLGAAVALLLLIGCANVANLMLAQASVRRREMAVRVALGAGRARLIRQLLVEGLMLATMSGAAGVLLTRQATSVLARIAVDYVPRVATVGVNLPVLGFAAGLSLLSGLLFTLAPALRASRPDVQRDLRDGARGATAGGRWLRDGLVVTEIAAAVVLVAGGALLLRSFIRVLRVDPGFVASQVVAADPELSSARYQTDATIAQFFSDVTARIGTIPGVRAAAAVSNVPLTGNGWTAWLTIENRPRTGEPPEVGYRAATAGYLEVMRIPLLAGRWIADTDTAAAQPVVVVNEALADRFFPSGNVLGSRVRLGPNPKAPWRTIVGVIGNVRHDGPEQDATPEAYNPFAQDPVEASLVVRADLPREALVAALRAMTTSVDSSVILARVQWLDALMDEHLAARRLSMLLVGGFAAVALSLALVGIYGVVTCTVAQRVPEIGVRIALGAAPAAIHRMVLRDGLRLALPGLLAGTLLALAVARLSRTLLFQVSPGDPPTFASVIALVLAVTALACYVPARRASRVDPLTAIRGE